MMKAARPEHFLHQGNNYGISTLTVYSPSYFFHLAVNKVITDKTLDVFLWWLNIFTSYGIA